MSGSVGGNADPVRAWQCVLAVLLSGICKGYFSEEILVLLHEMMTPQYIILTLASSLLCQICSHMTCYRTVGFFSVACNQNYFTHSVFTKRYLIQYAQGNSMSLDILKKIILLEASKPASQAILPLNCHNSRAWNWNWSKYKQMQTHKQTNKQTNPL